MYYLNKIQDISSSFLSFQKQQKKQKNSIYFILSKLFKKNK